MCFLLKKKYSWCFLRRVIFQNQMNSFVGVLFVINYKQYCNDVLIYICSGLLFQIHQFVIFLSSLVMIVLALKKLKLIDINFYLISANDFVGLACKYYHQRFFFNLKSDFLINLVNWPIYCK